MKKIPTLFVRDFENNPKRVTPTINPECSWVIGGEGIATFKWDGTSCKIDQGKLWKRREVRGDGEAPDGFFCEHDDPVTGKKFGWVPCDATDSSDRYHIEAHRIDYPDGTYELVGPKVQGNPHGFAFHELIPHGKHEVDAPRTFEALAEWLHAQQRQSGFEGVVWHHPDGRRAKIKARDFAR